ncbi:MAG: DUF3850 domain-containing protein [Bacilli bacterium]|jgi:hypothetical protein|nr:DUF3850 domain-containing protein [Bacilli bacterium]MCH4236036.1 DUF3850 domain-containing protein [Bacilli bacterium]
MIRKKLMEEFFIAKMRGKKNWELRKEDDCFFKVGDCIRYDEISPCGLLTGRYMTARVTYVLHGPFPGLDSSYCIYSDEFINEDELCE